MIFRQERLAGSSIDSMTKAAPEEDHLSMRELSESVMIHFISEYQRQFLDPFIFDDELTVMFMLLSEHPARPEGSPWPTNPRDSYSKMRRTARGKIEEFYGDMGPTFIVRSDAQKEASDRLGEGNETVRSAVADVVSVMDGFCSSFGAALIAEAYTSAKSGASPSSRFSSREISAARGSLREAGYLS